MIEQSQNKMQTPENTKELPQTMRAVSPAMNEYHFGGGGVYKPVSVRATSIYEAQLLYERVRQLIEEPAQPQPAQTENVELAKETSQTLNNE